MVHNLSRAPKAKKDKKRRKQNRFRLISFEYSSRLLKEAKEYGNLFVSRKHNLHESMVRRWAMETTKLILANKCFTKLAYSREGLF